MPRAELPIVTDVIVTGTNEETAEQIHQHFTAGIERAVDELVEARKIDLTTTDATNTHTLTLGGGKATVTITLSAHIPEESLKTVARCGSVHAVGSLIKLDMNKAAAHFAEFGRNVLVGLGETLTDLGVSLINRFGSERDSR